MADPHSSSDSEIPVEVDFPDGDRITPVTPVPCITPIPPPRTPMPTCLSREEQDSIRALADTSEETEQLAKSLYKIVAADPQGARTRSSDKFRAVRIPSIPDGIEKVPESSKGG